ncbi:MULTISPECIES: aminoglycoside phosphotransferase family protein [Mumia]|uniref:aminoglycoside phosphotransferase family protein n=1 Tax=Mumia TaxID=1546255 RepID=UPI00142429A8|nr:MULTISPECIES: aminoglycoside phosphotransferase family protein [unclassified Mumia]QMW68372.1 aminoglycoside phosphotransferase family protein [Mumia sp. ZJ1417]
MPAAEIDVTVPLVRGLLEAQHPDLAALPLRVVANGWDNVVLRLGDTLALRMPRRALAAALVRHEQEWLPVLAPHLPARVPAPVRTGKPSDGTRGPAYPWAWSIVPWFPGQAVGDLTLGERGGLMEPLAAFVVALHRPAPAEAPASAYRGVPLSARDDGMRERLATGHVPYADVLLALWDRLLPTPPWDGPALWVHGDLHPANLLAAPSADGSPTLSAVIDFGDVTSGDPASDLATAWLTFGPRDRAVFRRRVSEAGYADDATWDRALAWAALFGTLLVTSSDDAPMLRAIGEHTLAQVLADA